ncbi:hypothetical protein P4E94_00005, partial [Pontiellaceae bacterium B12219]|nr:hypothetical protein [Pontiellaceae bacterium B12219]
MNIKNQSLLLLFGISLFISGCNLSSEPLPTDVELALSPGMIVEFENANGQMKIEASSEAERTYTWGGATRVQTLAPRNRRWYGNKGISSSGHWRRRERTYPILSEGQQHFCSEAEAVHWLNYGWNGTGINLVYTSSLSELAPRHRPNFLRAGQLSGGNRFVKRK